MFWQKLFGTRLRWALIGSVGLVIAVIVEMIFHPLASMLCDVPGDPWAVLGLLFLAAAPLLSEWALRSEENLNTMRLARCVNGAAWVFWLALLVAIWPAFVVGGFGILAAPMLLLGGMASRQPMEGPIIATFPFLVFTPVVIAIVLLCQHVALKKTRVPNLRKPLWWTVFAALCLWCFRPMLLGYHLGTALEAGPEAREKSLAILRTIGGEYDLRMLAYQRRPTLSATLAQGGAVGEMNRSRDPAPARRAYFLLTGKPYTSAPVPPPQLGLFDRNDPLKIEEQGGEKVGAKVAGVTLSSSMLEASIDAPTRTATTLWTMNFSNASAEGQEARATVRLPEGAVISGVWLWIQGEKRPAAFGGKAQVRAAYEEVVKVQRRDPLLVTMTDPRRALVQCFPVPPRGEMQIQLEITQFLSDGRLALPALTDTNFTQPGSLRHRISLTGDGLERASALTESQMLQPEPMALTTGPSGLSERGEAIELTVAIDTSAQVGAWARGHREWLKTVEKSLPSGSTVRYADTRLPSPVETTSLDEALGWRFTGGVDAAPALATLAKRRAARPHAILWIHGPMPAEATELHPLHLAWQERDAPRLLGVLTAPGPDPVMDGIAGYKTVWVKDDATPENLAYAASARAAGPATATPVGGRWPAPQSFLATDVDGRESSLGKLHAWSKTLQGWYNGKRTDDLARYAASRRLVTPISGAVVLETKEQYQRHGLDPEKAPADPNPQVSSLAPEPGTLGLLLLGLLAYGYHRRCRARRGTSSSVGR
jgi:hypothetical protein